MFRVGQAALASLVAVGIAVVAPVAALGSGDGFVHQSKAPAPLLSRTTYIVTGTKTADGCHYTYPELRLRASETTRVQRDVGIDQANCRKLVEEGVPTTSETAPGADARISQPVGHQTAASTRAGLAEVGTASVAGTSSTVSSGYHATWFENFLGQTLTGDTTYITWIWNGTCATSGSSSGEWSWNTFYGWSLLSHGGSDGLACARYTGETHAVFGLGTCRHNYVHINAYGSDKGAITGDASQNSNCGPVWFHSSIVKTT